MNIITKKNVLISPYGPSEIHRVIIPKHSRNLKFKLLSSSHITCEAFKFFTKKFQFLYEDFYLNLPAIELICEFIKIKDQLCSINMCCVFEENKKYYYPLFPNILPSSSDNLPRVCMGYPYYSGPEYKITEQLKIELIHKYSCDFFTTIFDINGFDAYLRYAFNNKSKAKIAISKSDVEKLIDYGCIENNHDVDNIVHCFNKSLNGNYLMRLKNIISYIEWSIKSKENKQYSIFDDFKPRSVNLPENYL